MVTIKRNFAKSAPPRVIKSSGMKTNWVTRKHPPTHLIERCLFRISQVSQSVTWPNFLRVVCLGPADRLDSPSCTSPKVYTDSRISLCIVSNGLIRRWPFDELKPLQLAESSSPNCPGGNKARRRSPNVVRMSVDNREL